MNACHRLVALGIVAATMAACSSVGPSTSPAPSEAVAAIESPGPSPTAPTSSPSPTRTPMPVSIEGCPTVDEISPDSPFVDAAGSIGRFAVDLQVTHIEERSGQRQSRTPPPRELDNSGTGLMVGGYDFLISPSYYYEGYNPPITMEATSVTLTLEGAEPIELPVRFVPGNENYNQASVSVPDVAGTGLLAVSFRWTDKCFRLEASGSARVEVVPTSVTAECMVEEEAYWTQLESLFQHSLTVDSRDVRFGSPSNESKYAPYINPGIDAFSVYSFDKDDPAFKAVPGSALRVVGTNPALKLSNLELAVYTRRSIAMAVQDYPPYGTVLVLERRPAQQADGSWRLRVPNEPGRYVATLQFEFDSKCSTGRAWAVVNVDVTEPTRTPSPT